MYIPGLTVPRIHQYPHGRIVGGKANSIENYPYIATIQYANKPICSGVIISEYFLITAAHCVDTIKSLSTLTIRLDSDYRYKGGFVHRVEKLQIHENYVIDQQGIPINDIALIKLLNPLMNISPSREAKIFNASEQTPAGIEAQVSGWESDNGYLSTMAPVIFSTAKVQTLDKNVCDEVYNSLGGLPAGQICAAYYGLAGNDACQGDSGAPLIVEKRIAGILSWGNGCAKSFFPGVYTEISYYRDWIDEHAYLAPVNTITR